MSADVGTRSAFDGPHDTSVVGQPPTGLISLSVVAAHHGCPVDPQQLARALGLGFARPISESHLLLAAKELGLSAKSVVTHWDRLRKVTFPAIAELHTGEYVVLLRKEGGDHVLIGDPRQQRPQRVDRAAF